MLEIVVPSVLLPSLLFIGLVGGFLSGIAYKRRQVHSVKLTESKKNREIQLSVCSTDFLATGVSQ